MSMLQRLIEEVHALADAYVPEPVIVGLVQEMTCMWLALGPDDVHVRVAIEPDPLEPARVHVEVDITYREEMPPEPVVIQVAYAEEPPTPKG